MVRYLGCFRGSTIGTHCPSVHASAERRSACAPCLPGFVHASGAQHSTASTTLERKEVAHPLLICSRERRASAKVTHSVGSVMIKSLGQAFSKACGSRAAPWEPTDKHYLSGYLSPSLDQESARTLSRGSRYGERGSMPLSLYLSELQIIGYAVIGTTWADTALTSFALCPSSTVRWTVVRRTRCPR